MELKAAKDILEFLKTDGANAITTFYRVVTNGKRAFESVDFQSIETLNYGMRLLVYVAVFGFILEVPISAAVGLPYDNPAYVASSLVLVLVLWVCYATALHLGMKLLGGKAHLIQTLSAFCFLAAYFVPIMIVQWPLHKYLIPLLKDGSPFSTEFLFNLSAMELVSIFVLAVVNMILVTVYLITVFRVLRLINELSLVRSLSGFLLGIVGIALVVGVISLPLHETLYTAFQSHDSL